MLGAPDELLGILGMLLELGDVDPLGILGMELELDELEALGMLGMLELEELWLEDSQATRAPVSPITSNALLSAVLLTAQPFISVDLETGLAVMCLWLAVFIVSLI
jgi:hypothetical protein